MQISDYSVLNAFLVYVGWNGACVLHGGWTALPILPQQFCNPVLFDNNITHSTHQNIRKASDIQMAGEYNEKLSSDMVHEEFLNLT